MTEPRISTLAVGAVGDLLSLLATQIKLKDLEILAAIVETCDATGIRTLTITMKHREGMLR